MIGEYTDEEQESMKDTPVVEDSEEMQKILDKMPDDGDLMGGEEDE
jgi:hypothetical protein